MSVPRWWFRAGPVKPLLKTATEDRFWIDLQWFAAEDEGRSEEPTEQKIRKAREEGKVAKSTEFTSALVLLFPIIALGILAPYILGTLLDMLRFFLHQSVELDLARDARIVPAFFDYFLRITVPLFAVALVSAFLGNVFQVGFLFASKPITPDMNKIVPRFGKFFKRAFFSGEAAFNLGKSVLKILVIGTISFLNIRGRIDQIALLSVRSLWVSLQIVTGTAFTILVEAAIALLLLSIPDYVFQRHQHRESLKMTKQEVKEERRMSDGDPLVRSRLRERMRELLSRNMMRNVPNADLVVTNPTHYAIALEWNRSTMEAPVVMAKGMDNVALRIRAIAEENDVPCMENKPLARALYAEVEIGDAIPEKYYEVMALLLAEVYKIRGRTMEAV